MSKMGNVMQKGEAEESGNKKSSWRRLKVNRKLTRLARHDKTLQGSLPLRTDQQVHRAAPKVRHRFVLNSLQAMESKQLENNGLVEQKQPGCSQSPPDRCVYRSILHVIAKAIDSHAPLTANSHW